MHCNNRGLESFLHATDAVRSPQRAFASGNERLKMAEHSPLLSQLPNSDGVAANALGDVIKINTVTSLEFTNICMRILRNEIEVRVRSLACLPKGGVRIR
jgi:hypothetical protein